MVASKKVPIKRKPKVALSEPIRKDLVELVNQPAQIIADKVERLANTKHEENIANFRLLESRVANVEHELADNKRLIVEGNDSTAEIKMWLANARLGAKIFVTTGNAFAFIAKVLIAAISIFAAAHALKTGKIPGLDFGG